MLPRRVGPRPPASPAATSSVTGQGKRGSCVTYTTAPRPARDRSSSSLRCGVREGGDFGILDDWYNFPCHAQDPRPRPGGRCSGRGCGGGDGVTAAVAVRAFRPRRAPTMRDKAGQDVDMPIRHCCGLGCVADAQGTGPARKRSTGPRF
ncbi:hypothetical protein PCL_03528 [Purpureocillium lilacinum]|uniref:Uncharacterized protein n=1 Tax=Purpureocillium lilacinum TaxID=33203 RepID=A0A2U3EPA4_PURLI|nr:hypothetical protein PCL_03528 [Purpureocillium lilacinum]